MRPLSRREAGSEAAKKDTQRGAEERPRCLPDLPPIHTSKIIATTIAASSAPSIRLLLPAARSLTLTAGKSRSPVYTVATSAGPSSDSFSDLFIPGHFNSRRRYGRHIGSAPGNSQRHETSASGADEATDCHRQDNALCRQEVGGNRRSAGAFHAQDRPLAGMVHR